MRKIVITGGLGYIGMELARLYSGKSLNNRIFVLDKGFYSDRVKTLKNWNINFRQIDVLDETLLKETIFDADLIYHLAGVTDVGTTSEDVNKKRDKLVYDVGVKGTQNIIKYSKKEAKIIFPSTHVIFEGIKSVKKNISEIDEPKPNLIYSKSKYISENDLIKSGKNFVILRLGSVYGMSFDSTRLNIMPNHFAKVTSMSGEIKLFGGGKQLKSLVSVRDVARSMMHSGESEDIKREIFNCVNENLTVLGVAKICKKINNDLKILKTDDPIPNNGYGLSNKKIKQSGFKFLYNLEESLEEMINTWKPSPLKSFNEKIEAGSDPYQDSRGIIENFYFEEDINMIGYVESIKGSIRGNHYHPVQTQKCLLISGSYISITKDLSDENSVVETRLVKKGELSTIPPNVAHTMIFLEDSILLNLVTGDREHKDFGITHTLKYELVDDNLSKFLMENYKTTCRSCDSDNLELILSLGMSPLANNLLDKVNEKPQMYPLEINLCKETECFNVQLSVVVPPDLMFKEYLYVSSTTKLFKKHFEKISLELINDFKLNKKSLVVDIGSNDGIFLKPLKENEIRCIGVEPAINLAKQANKKGLLTIPDYFNEKVVKKISKNHGKADIITAFNVFAHADDLKGIALQVENLLKTNGSFIFEVQYFMDTLKDLTFDNIYHEHTNYWTMTSLIKFFESLNLNIYKVKKINTHGGSLRVYCTKSTKVKTDNSVINLLNKEKRFGIKNLSTYKEFSNQVKQKKEDSLKMLKKLQNDNIKIIGFGAPAKATTILNYYGINNKFIKFTIDDNSLKVNKFIPGTKIAIKSKAEIKSGDFDKILVLAWNFFDVIVNNNKEIFGEENFISLN